MCKAVNPAGQGNYEEVEGLYDMGHCANKLSVTLSDNNIIRSFEYLHHTRSQDRDS